MIILSIFWISSNNPSVCKSLWKHCIHVFVFIVYLLFLFYLPCQIFIFITISFCYTLSLCKYLSCNQDLAVFALRTLHSWSSTGAHRLQVQACKSGRRNDAEQAVQVVCVLICSKKKKKKEENVNVWEDGFCGCVESMDHCCTENMKLSASALVQQGWQLIRFWPGAFCFLSSEKIRCEIL